MHSVLLRSIGLIATTINSTGDLRLLPSINLITSSINLTVILLHHVTQTFYQCSQNSVPSPASRGRQLRLGRTTSLPITAGDQHDPTGGETTAPPPPSVGVDDGFMLASSARGHRTTPTDRAMVVEGTPLQQNNRFVHGTPSASEDEENSPISDRAGAVCGHSIHEYHGCNGGDCLSGDCGIKPPNGGFGTPTQLRL